MIAVGSLEMFHLCDLFNRCASIDNAVKVFIEAKGQVCGGEA